MTQYSKEISQLSCSLSSENGPFRYPKNTTSPNLLIKDYVSVRSIRPAGITGTARKLFLPPQYQSIDDIGFDMEHQETSLDAPYQISSKLANKAFRV